MPATETAVTFPLATAAHSFTYVANLYCWEMYCCLEWIRTKRADVAIRRATNLATHLPILYPDSWCSLSLD